MPTASEYADNKLADWIRAKMKSPGGIDPSSKLVITAPDLVGQMYYYRVGEIPSDPSLDGWGMGKKMLAEQINEKIAAGLPPIERAKELPHIADLFYRTLRDAYPERNFTVKTFLGDIRLETSEQEIVHYGAEAPISQWIEAFNEAINPTSGRPAWGIMTGHGSLVLKPETFPGIEKMRPPEIPDFIMKASTEAVRTILKEQGEQGETLPEAASAQEVFSHVPASMNPFINQYLREIKGYKGMIVGDWYDMKGAEIFAMHASEMINSYAEGKNGEKVEFDKNSFPSTYDVATLLAVTAGVTHIRTGARNTLHWEFWDKFEQTGGKNFEQFSNKLNTLILTTYNTLKKPEDPEKTIDDIKKYHCWKG